jgi:hypothetical protein
MRRDSFFNCSAGVKGGLPHDDGCVGIENAMSVAVADCCATKCGAFHGGLRKFRSEYVDLIVTGLVVFDWKSAEGALHTDGARVHMSACNFTKLNRTYRTDGSYGTDGDSGTAAFCQELHGSSTNARFVLFERYLDAFETFWPF